MPLAPRRYLVNSFRCHMTTLPSACVFGGRAEFKWRGLPKAEIATLWIYEYPPSPRHVCLRADRVGFTNGRSSHSIDVRCPERAPGNGCRRRWGIARDFNLSREGTTRTCSNSPSALLLAMQHSRVPPSVTV